MRPGSDVEVRSRFDGDWVGGFQVAEVSGSGSDEAYHLRRISDGAVLPVPFERTDLRERATGFSAAEPGLARSG